MNSIYALIVVSLLNLGKKNDFYIPYYEVISTHTNYETCDKEIIKTHDYYLPKDIRRKNTKQRKPKFIYDEKNNKLLTYKEKGLLYYASCKFIEIKKINNKLSNLETKN